METIGKSYKGLNTTYSKEQIEIINRKKYISNIINNDNKEYGINKRRNIFKNNADLFLKILIQENLLITLPEIEYKKDTVGFEINNIYKEYYKYIIYIDKKIKDINKELIEGLDGLGRLKTINKGIKKLFNLNDFCIKYDIGSEKNNKALLLLADIKKLYNLINDTKEDIIEYYSNKKDILNLIGKILSKTKAILNSL